MAKSNVNVAGTWKLVTQLSIKDSGAWKAVKAAFVRDGGAWTQIFAASVEAATKINSWFPTPTYAPANALVAGSVVYQAAQQFFGATIDTILTSKELANPDDGDASPITAFYFGISFKSTGLPAFTGSIKLTNVTTGVSFTTTKVSATVWWVRVPVSGGTPGTKNPYQNWIRNGATDTFRVEAV